MLFSVGLLWILFVLFFHIVLKYSIDLKFSALLMKHQREKYENPDKYSRKEIVERQEMSSKVPINEEEELFNYINSLSETSKSISLDDEVEPPKIGEFSGYDQLEYDMDFKKQIESQKNHTGIANNSFGPFSDMMDPMDQYASANF